MHGPSRPSPTIVLVHGAFTDASSWAEVIALLHIDGRTVLAPANPLRDLAQDAAWIRSVVQGIDVPVVLVGHDYGGAVITQAATDTDNVVALCYVAAFGLDTGECVLDVVNRFAPAPGAGAIVTADLPARTSGRPERGIRLREDLFPQAYAADLPPLVTEALAVAQRPIACDALTGRSGRPAWTSTPSWYAIATADRILNPTAQRFMAQRMAAAEHMLDGSHAVLMSQPDAVVAMILEAAEQSRCL
ncbi:MULTISPECIES: alpha/beta fold hydrolase [Streptomyces]|uniref:alpha/beta fold hydrolase n=1 Tax=Streptomyces TaxID=1883 RepID=UPI0022E99645|nr:MULTISPECIES: alpha/beta hydrolase [Streptomyces]MDI3097182.1 alpha/beta hydrolase [Streptomyces sp. AN-3]WDI19885.1 alpha/beta hydrolase [Streptomyces enissocaesilis]WQC14335.1 alpha/beta hydrolase [Streptomyces rochei]